MGDRLLSIDGIPLHGASHATAIATLQQCSHEALFQVEYDVATPGMSRSEGKGWDEVPDPQYYKVCVSLGQYFSLSGPLDSIRHLQISLGIWQGQYR